MSPHKTDTGRLAYEENGFRFVVSTYHRRRILEGNRFWLWRFDFNDGPSGAGYPTRSAAVKAAREQIAIMVQQRGTDQ